jgi:hypothetical protein
MKTKQMNYLVALILLVGMTFAGCKKDKSTDTVLAGTDVATAQDAESQDAVADNVDNMADNQIDLIEANNFNSNIQKSALGSGTSWTCPQADDTIRFPKKITITFGDTTINNEHLHYTGSIVITDSLPAGTHGSWRNFVIRKIEFNAFGIATDSSSFTVTGKRTVTRTSVKYAPALTAVTPNTTSLRLDVKDAITANLTFTIRCGDYNYTGTFTRNIDRTREAIAHFQKGLFGWHQVYVKDTLIFKGSVSGTNLQNVNYSRTISETKPLTFTRCLLLVPILTGEITLTNGTNTAILDYTTDGCKTQVTITKGDKVKVIERKLNRSFHKWW